MQRRTLQLWLALWVGLAATAATQDPKPEIENNWVRVLRVRQGPHERSALRDWPPSVVVYLTDAQEMVTGADGKPREVRHKAGETAYVEASRRSEENLSD